MELNEPRQRRQRGAAASKPNRQDGAEVIFLAPGDVAKGRVEPISWMQTCRAYADQGFDVSLVTLRVRRPDGVARPAIWRHYGLKPSFNIVGERTIRVRERTPHALADGIHQALMLEDGGEAMSDRAAAWVSERTWERRTGASVEALGL
jgi:hypothetical protein